MKKIIKSETGSFIAGIAMVSLWSIVCAWIGEKIGDWLGDKIGTFIVKHFMKK